MARVTKEQLQNKIENRLWNLAREAYDPDDEPEDSDGLDQAEREGLLQAIAVVGDEFRKATITVT